MQESYSSQKFFSPLNPVKGLGLKCYLSGFSFVELVVVISMMALLFTVGYANYRDFQRKQHLESAVRMVKADLRLAQEMALAGRVPSDPPCDTKAFGGYIFRRTGQGDKIQYKIQAACPDSHNTVDKKEVELPDKINMLGFGGGNIILFNPLGRGVDRADTVCIRLQFPGSGLPQRLVLVTPSGEIYDQEGGSCP